MLTLTQSTAATIKMGPFLDITDGVTEEVGLTTAYTSVFLSKGGGNFAAKNETTAISHDQDGWYDVLLDATDTNTLGRLQVFIQEPATHLPVWAEFNIQPAQVYAPPAAHQHIGHLAYNTAAEIVVGPFISISTGLPLTSLTVGDITCAVLKFASPPTSTAITLTASAGNNDFVHIANGYWRMEITTTDTNALGRCAFTFQDPDVFRPLTVEAFVVSSEVYAGLIATTGLPADLITINTVAANVSSDNNLQVDLAEINDVPAAMTALYNAIDQANNNVAADVQQVSGDTTAADNLELAHDGTGYAGGTILPSANIGSIAGVALPATNLGAMMNAGMPTFTVDDTSFAPTTTAWESTATEATASHYVDCRVVFTSGALTGAGGKAVSAYSLVGGRGKFTVSAAFTDAPATGDTFYLVP